ncbi:MAG TPA: YitT family protein [Chitinophagaceae bacterium]|nr:YitT family protein [Chitinophagaceae bacterium]
MQYQQAYDFLMPKLENELPPGLAYHNATHTRSVIAAAEYLAAKENITGDDLVILKTAALFHDAGFLQQADGHEEISCIMARDYLPDLGYTDSQVEHICRMIMATHLPQNPADHLGQILCDADLFYIGKKGYQANAENLYQEFKQRGIVKTESEWPLIQVEFLSNHEFFTRTAVAELEPTKQEILKELKSRLDKALSSHTEDKPAQLIQDIVLMIIGVTIAGAALKLFLVPNHFFDGGVTGISLLVHESYHFNLGLVILVLNLPLIIVSYFSIGKRFALRTLLSVILLGVALLLIPNEGMTKDKLLISVFGGAFLGIGIGLVMRTGAALDGIEVLAVYTLKRTSFTISEIILGINIIIFAVAGFRFGLETAVYSILTYFTATRCIDYVVEGLQAYTGVTIVSGKSEAIKYQLVNKLGRGITVYKGERGFLPGQFDVSSDCDIIFTVITRLELRKLKNLVYDVDPKAFVFANTIKEASGGIIKRRHAH